MTEVPNEIQELFDKYAFHLHEFMEKTGRIYPMVGDRINSEFWGIEFVGKWLELRNDYDLYDSSIYVTTMLGETYQWISGSLYRLPTSKWPRGGMADTLHLR